jgi:hypothetical protein
LHHEKKKEKRKNNANLYYGTERPNSVQKNVSKEQYQYLWKKYIWEDTEFLD